MPVERLLGSDKRYSQQEIADESGLALEYLQATRRALGLGPPPDAKVLGERDLESARIGARLLEAGFDEEGMLEASRVLGRGMARYAEAIRTLGGARCWRAARTSTSSAAASPPPRRRCSRSPGRGWSTRSRCTSGRCCAPTP